jgi:molybdopterin molybdotransferase
MTGAVLPDSADAVIPYEDCRVCDGVASVRIAAVRQRQNIHLQGTDSKAGDLLIPRNTRISGATAGIMATVGRDRALVRRLPRVAVCATGDELVDIGDRPAPHQIRRSNSYMLAAALEEDGIRADMYHLPDERSAITTRLAGLLGDYDALLFSGAVSKGKYDFLPDTLSGLGMQAIFHGVAQRPGKPLLFGCFPDGPIVFGLPGNPASTLVSYAVFFRAWLYGSLHTSSAPLSAELGADIDFAPALTYHLLATLHMAGGRLIATPCPGANSGDMIALQRANAVISLPADASHFRAGEAYPLTLLAPFGH